MSQVKVKTSGKDRLCFGAKCSIKVIHSERRITIRAHFGSSKCEIDDVIRESRIIYPYYRGWEVRLRMPLDLFFAFCLDYGDIIAEEK